MKAKCQWCERDATMRFSGSKGREYYERFACPEHYTKTGRLVTLDGVYPESQAVVIQPDGFTPTWMHGVLVRTSAISTWRLGIWSGPGRTMTDAILKKLDEWKKLSDGATEGPWDVDEIEAGLSSGYRAVICGRVGQTIARSAQREQRVARIPHRLARDGGSFACGGDSS